jgi:hypothetical protein
MVESDYSVLIGKCTKEIERFIKSKEWANDEKVVGLFSIYYEAIYSQIHNVLVPQKTEKAEKQIREIISKCIIGYTARGKTYFGALNPLKSKMVQLSKQKRINVEFAERYMELYDNFMALASFRSFEHFALYIEMHLTKDDEVKSNSASGGDNKIIEHTLPLFKGWYYYATKMVLDGDVKFIGKQMPTSYGKSYGDVLLIPFIYGIDINNDVIKVFGNPYNVERCFESITDLMCRPE